MLRRIAVSLVFALGLCGAPLAAQEAAPPPKLVVAISVDQFSADLFAQYREHFTGGLGRLLTGAVFPSGYQSHAATETCPGHSTLLTGARPARTGIIANEWYDLGIGRQNKQIYCAEDEAQAADPYVPSAIHLLVPTLGERLKAVDPRSRNIAVSGKDRGALMMGGTQTDEVYFWFNTRFRTLDGRAEPAELAAANAQVDRVVKAGIKPYPLPAWCQGADRAIAVGHGAVGNGRLALPAGDTADLRKTPMLDRITLDLAEALVTSRRLGKGPVSDLLSVSLSANDYVGHAYGTNGAEMCIQVHELDAALGQFFAFLDKTGVDYAVVLTADHGGFDLPERLDQQALPQAVRADPRLTPRELGKAIAAKLGIAIEGNLLFGGLSGDIWVSRAVTPAQKAAVLAELKALERTDPQVAAVFTSDELAAMPMPGGAPDTWSLAQRARASFYAPRSGDAVILLAKDVVPIPNPTVGGTIATHGSAWDYDRRVPILFWRKGLRHFEQPAPVETVDIAPSLAALLDLHLPSDAFDGRCLDLDGGDRDTCRR